MYLPGRAAHPAARTRSQGGPTGTSVAEGFDFLFVAHAAAFFTPADVGDGPFRLIAQYNADATTWEHLDWINLYDPTTGRYRITGDLPTGRTRKTNVVQVKTYRAVLLDHLRHPEAKYADPDGQPCSPSTRGWLARQRIRITGVRLIGKESNRLEDVEAGLVTARDQVQLDYGQTDHAWLETLAAVDHLSGRELARLAGVDRRTIDRLRHGEARPRPSLQQRLIALAKRSIKDT